MTDTEALALGQRALAAGFALADGVLLQGPSGDVRVYGVRDDGPAVGVVFFGAGMIDDYRYWRDEKWRAWWPDFRDAASMGVLEAQARERHGDDSLFVRQIIWGAWNVFRGTVEPEALNASGPSRASAWVAALEARQ
jgi:hypothetical protein